MSTFQKHMLAIEAGEVQKSNVIGIRKAINAYERQSAGYSTSSTSPAWSADEVTALERRLSERQPDVTGELHASGLKVLRNPRYRRRWNEAQAAIIERLHGFKLVRFDYIGRNGSHAIPVYRACATTGQSFLFRNIPWQTAFYMGEESGPVVVSEEER